MIIPIRCFTCGNVLGDKWIPYITTVQEEKNKVGQQLNGDIDTTFLNLQNPEKSIEGKVLDEMGLKKYCCRRHMISNVHLISYIS
jgi:DNA-directed RNA polymerase subunit N (RpoN/RPB10)